MAVFSIPFLLLLICKFKPLPFNNPKFLIATLIATCGFVIGNALLTKASEISPISLTAPFLALTPIPMILIEFIVMGNLPTKYGIAGILLIATGSYMLNVSESKHGILGPIKAIGKEKGSLLAIGAAMIFSIGGVLDKYAIGLSDPYSYLALWTISGAILSALMLITKRKSLHILNLQEIKKNIPMLLFIGFLMFITSASNFVANTMAFASYVLAIKRTSAFFSVILGWKIFKEIKIKERILGTLVMIAGVVLISTLG
jgi:drug/metabolite transporter (DMT)-like permease